MELSVILLIFTIIGASSGQFVAQGDNSLNTPGCTVSVKDDFSGFYPMIFDTEGAFWPYTKSATEDATWDLHLPNGKDMIVSCAPNYLRQFNDKKSAKFSCNDGKLTNDLGVDKKWKDVNCELRPMEEILASVEHCETTSHIGVEFGFVNPVSRKAMIMGQACYSQEKGHTEFVHMKLKPGGKSFDEAALKVEPEQYFMGKRHPNGRYKINMMKAWGDYAKTWEDNSYIPIEPQRYAFPQSVHLNTMKKQGWNYAFSQEGHNTWNMLQEEVSAMALKKSDLMDYYAGSHGVMKLNGVDMYLKDGKFAMPKYLWMFVKDGVQGMAFVVYNKKQMTSEEESEFQGVCSSKCDQVQWLGNGFKEMHQEYVLCCDVNDARAKIPEMPLVTGITKSFLY